MERMISDMIASYEKGTLSRRELVGGLAMVAAASAVTPVSAADQGYRFTAVNHIHIDAGNLQRSAQFYERVLGLPVIRRTDKAVRLAIGTEGHHLELRQSPGAARLNHISLEVTPWDKAGMDRILRSRGAKPTGMELTNNVSLHVLDPDGFDIQLEPLGGPA
jgi:catechol-2,3-dioxygenase